VQAGVRVLEDGKQGHGRLDKGVAIFATFGFDGRLQAA
jgi:hypothetical protein